MKIYLSSFDELIQISKGEIPTFATWMREFIENHPDYQNDNVISDKINHDINLVTSEITKGTVSIDTFYWKTE